MWWNTSWAVRPASPDPGAITDRRTIPPGVVPRHLQQWVLVGVAVVMVAILALVGSPPTPRVSAGSSPTAVTVDANQQRIEAYGRRIQEQAQRLAAEQARLQLTKEALGADANASSQKPPRFDADRGHTTATTAGVSASREDRARFADNVAFSRPRATPPAVPLPVVTSEPLSRMTTPAPAPPVPVAMPDGRIATGEASIASQVAASPRTNRSSSTPDDEIRYHLFEGTVIDTVLTNRLDGTFTGPVNALVSVPVYASDQQHLVIPAGSRVLGEARAVTAFGQSRLAVVFHRVRLPNGRSIDFDGFHGLNQVGDLGLRDEVDRHYAQIFGVSLAIGAIAGFAQAQSAVGFDATGLDTYRQGAAANVSQSSTRILDRFLNLLPTVTIREGHRIKVYVSSDLEVPAYHDALDLPGGRP
jgi:type IV secretory pathway VirB10-like protein